VIYLAISVIYLAISVIYLVISVIYLTISAIYLTISVIYLAIYVTCLVIWGECGERELGADQGADAGGEGGFVEAGGAVHAISIEQRQRRVAERRRTLDERFGERGALEKRKGRGRVEFDVHDKTEKEQPRSTKEHEGHEDSPAQGIDPWSSPDCSPCSRVSSCLRGLLCGSVDNALQEPLADGPFDRQAVDGAVDQLNIPLVAIPGERRACRERITPGVGIMPGAIGLPGIGLLGIGLPWKRGSRFPNACALP
jgi:hypothetical protein